MHAALRRGGNEHLPPAPGASGRRRGQHPVRAQDAGRRARRAVHRRGGRGGQRRRAGFGPVGPVRGPLERRLAELPQHIKRTGNFHGPLFGLRVVRHRGRAQCRHPEFPLDSRDGGFRPRCGVPGREARRLDHEGHEPHDRRLSLLRRLRQVDAGVRRLSPAGRGLRRRPGPEQFPHQARGLRAVGCLRGLPQPLAGRLRRAEHPAGAFSPAGHPQRRSCGRVPTL